VGWYEGFPFLSLVLVGWQRSYLADLQRWLRSEKETVFPLCRTQGKATVVDVQFAESKFDLNSISKELPTSKARQREGKLWRPFQPIVDTPS